MHNTMDENKQPKKDEPFIQMSLGAAIFIAVVVILAVAYFVNGRHQADQTYTNNDACVARVGNC